MKTNRRTTLQIVFTLVVVVVVILWTPVGRALNGLLWQVAATPLGEASDATREARSIIDLVRSIRTLHQESLDLKAESLRLQAELESLGEVRHENELLRRELGFAEVERAKYDLTPATIIGRSPSSFLQQITVDRGTRDGIVVGQAVVSQGFLIGHVIEVTTTTATVELITASRSKLPITLSSSRATGILQGGLAGLTAEELPSDSQVESGEGVITSGLGQIIPAGIPVGSVERVLSVESDFVARAAIHSPIAFSKLEIVLILQPK